MKMAASIKCLQQIGPDDWQMQWWTKVFDEHTEIITILTWAQHYCKSFTIQDIIFSVVTE